MNKISAFFISALLLMPLPSMAQEADFLAASRAALDNEILRSPVYTKRVYRSIIESDRQKYNETVQALNKLKADGKITNQTYEKRLKILNETFNQTHQKDLIRQGIDISAQPVDSYYGAVMTTERTTLMKMTYPELYYENFSFPPVQTEKNNDGTVSDLTQGTPADTRTFPTRRKVGQRSFPINLGDFK